MAEIKRNDCLTIKYSVDDLVYAVEHNDIAMGHPSQRSYDQWDLLRKSGLIADVLQGYSFLPLIFAEENTEAGIITWCLDGKQRTDALRKFLNNEIRISRNIIRFNIPYETVKIDTTTGEPMRNKQGVPLKSVSTFDIRGKRFNDLPQELRDKFRRHSVDVIKYLNCSEEDISYHIARYNMGKPMNKAQRGATLLNYDTASQLKLTTGNKFFREYTVLKKKTVENTNSNLNRIIIEAVMAADYMDYWSKDLDIIHKYIDSRGSEGCDAIAMVNDCLNEFYDALETDDDPESVAALFDDAYAYMWIAIYKKNYSLFGGDATRYIEFLHEFAKGTFDNNRYDDIADGMTYTEYVDPNRCRATKDRYYIIPKMKLIKRIMCDFLGVEYVDDDAKNTEDNAVETVSDIQPDSTDVDLANDYLNFSSPGGVTLDGNIDNNAPNSNDIFVVAAG